MRDSAGEGQSPTSPYEGCEGHAPVLREPSSLASVLCHDGETKSAREWSPSPGIPEATIAERIRKRGLLKRCLGSR